jgi:hypothetical protein
MKPLRPSFVYIMLLLLPPLLIAQAPNQDFSLIVMPDVQNESQFYPQVLLAQTQWIANSQDKLNIQAVLGLGDIVNNGSDNSQWVNADAAYEVLDEAEIPYFLALGNHDYDNLAPKARTAVGFNQWFGPQRYAAAPWYLGNLNGSNENFYGVLTINGKQYLFLVLEFIPQDATLAWAASVVAANPDKEVFVVTHSFMYSDNTRVDQCDTQDINYDNYGDKQWSKFVSQYPNIDMVLSGHITNANGSRRVDLGVGGNLVNQIFANYQLLPNGGNGYLRILTFHPASDTVDVKTYSPYLNLYKTDSGNQFTINWHAPAITATTGTISGLVRDTISCKPIAGAQVTSGTASATTDSKGHYSLTLPGGSYPVGAAANLYLPASQTVQANNGYSADTNFYMVSATAPPCTLSTTSPSVTICTPTSNATVTSPLTVAAGATDSQLVSYIQLFVDGIANTKQNGAILNTSIALTPGSHRITVQAKDITGLLIKQTLYVTAGSSGTSPCTLNTASPSVTICSQANNATVTSPLTVSAGTTDTNPVSIIQLYVDGSAKLTQNSGTLNGSVTLTAGTHKLTVQAKDSAGTVFKQTIYVTAQ